MADIASRLSWIGSNHKIDINNENKIQDCHYHHQFVEIIKPSNSVKVKVSGFFLDSTTEAINKIPASQNYQSLLATIGKLWSEHGAEFEETETESPIKYPDVQKFYECYVYSLAAESCIRSIPVGSDLKT